MAYVTSYNPNTGHMETKQVSTSAPFLEASYTVGVNGQAGDNFEAPAAIDSNSKIDVFVNDRWRKDFTIDDVNDEIIFNPALPNDTLVFLRLWL